MTLLGRAARPLPGRSSCSPGGGVRDAADLARAGRRRGGRRPGRDRPARRRDRGRRAARAAVRSAARAGHLPRSRCSTSAAATSTPVARSTPCQPGIAVDLDHVVAPVGGAQQVDAGVVGAERRGGPHAQRRTVVVQRDRPRAGAAREVRPPARPHALDRGDDAVPDDHRANVDAVVGQRLLQVVDGPLDLQRAEHPLRDVRGPRPAPSRSPSSRTAA